MKFIRASFFIFTLTLSALKGQTSGQNFTGSPYSNFGLGEQFSSDYIQNNAGFYTRSGAYSYSLNNPATVSNIQFTSFDFGINFKEGLIKNSIAKKSFTGGGFECLGLGFKLWHKTFFKFGIDSLKKPMRKKIFKIGLNGYGSVRPISTVGYNYFETGSSPLPFSNAHSGSGGLQLAEFGLGTAVTKNLAIGYSIGYVFGNIRDASFYSINDSIGYQLISDDNNRDIRGTKHNFGLTYQFSTDSFRHKLGATYGMFSQMYENKNRLTTAILFNTVGQSYSGDTLVNIQKGYRLANYPTYLGLGYEVTWRNKITLQGSYGLQDWKKVKNTYSNRQHIAVGLILNPNDIKPKNAKRTPVQIRVRYEQIQNENLIKIGTGQVRILEQRVFVGFGFPIMRKYYDNTQLRSMVNVDLGYVTRGSITNGLVKEEYFTARVSFSLGDLWFQKQKFN